MKEQKEIIVFDLFDFNQEKYNLEIQKAIKEGRLKEFLKINIPLMMLCRAMLQTWERQWESYSNSTEAIILKREANIREKEFIKLQLSCHYQVRNPTIHIYLKNWTGNIGTIAHITEKEFYIFEEFINKYSDFIKIEYDK